MIHAPEAHSDLKRCLLANVSGSAVWMATACASTTPGTAVTSPTTSSTNTPTNVFVGVRSCGLLRSAVANQGLEPVEQFNISSDDGCHTSKWQFAAVGIELDDRQGLKEFRAKNSSARAVTVNGRKALESAENNSLACKLVVEVTQHARMLVITEILSSTGGDACAVNTKVATAAEPQLPKAN